MSAGRWSDERADEVIASLLDLAVTVRDELGPVVAAKARAVLEAAAGDPVAALTVAAALIRVDLPLDVWWQRPEPPARADVDRLLAVAERESRRRASCGTHSAFNGHRARGEEPDLACRLAERAYQRGRKRAVRGGGVVGVAS